MHHPTKLREPAHERDTMSSTSVAIVVTACDYGRFLADCLRSIDRQSRPPDQVLVIDDASIDETPAVLRTLAKELDLGSRLEVHRNTARQGLARSLNTAIAATGTDFVAHVDADDVVEPRYVELLCKPLEAGPDIGFAYPRLRLFGSETGLMASYPFDPARLVFEGNYIANVAMMRRAAFDQTPGFRDLRTHIDWDLWLSFIEAGWPGVLVDEPLYNWRRHGVTMTHQTAMRRLAIRFDVMNHHRGLMWRHRRQAAEWTWQAARRRLPGGSRNGVRLTRSGWVEPD